MGKLQDLLNLVKLSGPIPYTTAIILAAGDSVRMGEGSNKLFTRIGDKPVLVYTLEAYQKCPEIRDIVIVAKKKDFDTIQGYVDDYGITKFRAIVPGGSTRQRSAYLGLQAVSRRSKFVAIADGARCLTKPQQISSVCYHAYKYKAAGAAHLCADSAKRANASNDIVETVDRQGLWQMQTPQVFHTVLYYAALKKAKADKFTATDDSSLIEHLGFRVRLVECGYANMKLTTPDDMEVAAAILNLRG